MPVHQHFGEPPALFGRKPLPQLHRETEQLRIICVGFCVALFEK
jgi:hypothetical protein